MQGQIIQITNEDGCNASQVPVSASCTNLVQFNLDFRAFQQMAHPGYGLMNAEYRYHLIYHQIVGCRTDMRIHLMTVQTQAQETLVLYWTEQWQ